MRGVEVEVRPLSALSESSFTGGLRSGNGSQRIVRG
jgi:hypothetical protein